MNCSICNEKAIYQCLICLDIFCNIHKLNHSNLWGWTITEENKNYIKLKEGEMK